MAIEHEIVEPALLERSSILDHDEKQIIEFIRNNPEEKDSIMELLKK